MANKSLPPYGGSYKDAATRNGGHSLLCSRHRELADKSSLSLLIALGFFS